MKIIYLSMVTLAMILASCGAEESSDKDQEAVESVNNTVELEEETQEVVNSFIISEGTVGIFVVGREVPQMPKELKIRQSEDLNNVIFNQLEDVVKLIMNHDAGGEHPEDKVIEEMMVLSGYYETAEGVMVGTTVEEFIEKLDDAKIYFSNVINELYIETPAYPKVQFIMSVEDYEGKIKKNQEKESLSLGDLVFGAKIKKIRVY